MTRSKELPMSPIIVLDGVPWAYTERGTGPLLVFLHGRLLGK